MTEQRRLRDTSWDLCQQGRVTPHVITYVNDRMLRAQRHGTFFFFLDHKSRAVKRAPKLITRIININQQGLNKSRQQG